MSPATNKQTLFSDESDAEGTDTFKLKINKNYANNYDKWRAKEELQRLKDLNQLAADSDDNSSSDGIPSDDEMATPTIHTLSMMAASFEALKDGNAKNFNITDKAAAAARDPDAAASRSSKKKKADLPYTVEVHHRERMRRIDEGSVQMDTIREDDKEPNLPKQLPKVKIDDSGDEDDEDDLLVPVDGTSDTKQSSSESQDKTESKAALIARIEAALYKPDMTEDEKWLANFFVQQSKEAVESDSDDSFGRGHYGGRRCDAAAEGDSHGFVYEDEAEATRRTITEAVGKFSASTSEHRSRSFPAVLQSTVRVKSDRRKQQRLREAERKAAEKQRLRHEVQQLQAIKMKEIQDKLKHIKEAAGQDKIAFDEHDLDEEFDPSAHDRKMEEQYGEQYYQGPKEKKPTFEFDEHIDGDMFNYDNYEVRTGDHGDGYDEEEEEEEDYGNDEGDEQGNPSSKATSSYQGDADADDAAAGEEEEEVGVDMMPRRRRHKNKRQAQKDRLARALRRKKPLFDPAKHDFDQYFDEYYGLDFEDVIGGDIKCRFPYKTVEPNSYGLTTEEIMCADDKELNRWYSLRKMLRTDRTEEQEARERKVYRIKADNKTYLKKVIPTLFEPPVEEQSVIIDEAAAQKAEEERKKRKNLKKKLRKQRKAERNVVPLESTDLEEPLPAASEDGASPKLQKKRSASEALEQTTEDQQQQPAPKKVKHSTVSEPIDTSSIKRPKSHDKKHKVKHHHESDAASVPHVKADRSARKDLVVGDGLSTVLKLSDQRLAAYNIKGVSKIKRHAKYQDKLAHEPGKGGKAGKVHDSKAAGKQEKKKKKSKGGKTATV